MRLQTMIAATTLIAATCLACGANTPTGPKPKPALGASGSSQLEFRELSRAWHAATPERRNQLDQALREFIQKYPRDELRRPANVYLAWILIQKGEVLEARERISLVKAGPEGAAQDFAVVAEAALLTHYGQAKEAIKLLRPIQGKVIDPVERFLATEQLVYAAMASEYYTEAVLYLVDWAHQAAERDRPRVHEAAESLLRRVPQRYLEEVLPRLEPTEDDPQRLSSPLRYAQRQWLYSAVSTRLASLALESKNVELAQKVLTHNPSLGGTNGNSEQLVRLATGAETNVTISSRTVGLLLSTRDQVARRHSSEVASGLALALNPRPLGNAARLNLVFSEDSGNDSERALHDLTSAGAALIVAGVDALSAVGAAQYAARLKVPVLLLEPIPKVGDFVFSLGLSATQQLAVLQSGLTAEGAAIARTIIVRQEECVLPDVAGTSRFPITSWKESGTQAVILMTSDECAREVHSEAAAQGLHPTFALGLDANGALQDLRNEQLLLIEAGYFPLGPGGKSLQQFTHTRGRMPTWYEALGHDAGAIARQVLGTQPELTSDDAREVGRFHEQVRQALARVGESQASHLELWSSRQGRFDTNRVLLRKLDYKRRSP